jgi:hypothetical protein
MWFVIIKSIVLFFAIAWTIGIWLQGLNYIIYVYKNEEYKIPCQYSIMISIFWSLFYFLNNIV